MVEKNITTHTLSVDERQALIAMVSEQHGSALSEGGFADVMLGLFEDIPGFETMPPATSGRVLNQLWNLYMSKKPKAVESITTGTVQPVVVDLNQPMIRAAIEQGQAVLADGKTKADAARAMYSQLKDEPKEVIVSAFVTGANLTEKGALTYWYNCRRKAAKAAADS